MGTVNSVRNCEANIQKTLQLAEAMILLADRGDADREDVGCGILYGILRDAAFKIKKQAQKEKQAHMANGRWPSDTSGPNQSNLSQPGPE